MDKTISYSDLIHYVLECYQRIDILRGVDPESEDIDALYEKQAAAEVILVDFFLDGKVKNAPDIFKDVPIMYGFTEAQ